MNDLVLSRQQSREIDRVAIDNYGFTGLVLMENAGRGVVDTLKRLGIDGPIVILCGKGNNGGDGFVIARHLVVRGFDTKVFLLASPVELTGDARINFAILEKCGVPIVDLSSDVTPASLDAHGQNAAWLVDAMLGTGARGEPRPPIDVAIEWMNSQAAKTMVVDVPSGLDCDTGIAASQTVRADHTCTFVAMKRGFMEPTAKEYLGEVHVVDIGIPRDLLEAIRKKEPRMNTDKHG